MEKVCLITPPSQFLLDERVFAALGILKVAASLERAGWPVEHLDLAGIANYEDVTALHARSTTARIFALTATSPQMPAATRITDTLRKERPDATLVIGGPHATLVNAAAKLEQRSGRAGRAAQALANLRNRFHVVVAGDGENAVFAALDPCRPADTWLVDADDPKSPHWLTHQGFTESPWPARHLIDLRSYRYAVDGEAAASMIGQLGCPYRCSFCAGRDSAFLRRTRLRPPESVIAELEHLYEAYGLKGCMFLDDELNVNRLMLDLMRGLKASADRRGIEWRLRGFLKAELFDDEQAEAMYAAGFRQLLIGFEAGHERILENIQKVATRADNTRAVEIGRRHGLKVKALMSIGHPGESEETVLALRDWLLEVKPSDFDVTVITPYPGSPYYDHAALLGDGAYCYTAPKTGDRLYMQDVDFAADAQYYKGAPGSYRSFVWTDHLTPERIVALRDAVEDEVRRKLSIPFYPTGSAINYEHSMGMGPLPAQILRVSQ